MPTEPRAEAAAIERLHSLATWIEGEPSRLVAMSKNDAAAIRLLLAAVERAQQAEETVALLERLLSSPEERLDIARLETSQIAGWQVAKFHDGLEGFSNAETLLAALRALAAHLDGGVVSQ